MKCWIKNMHKTVVRIESFHICNQHLLNVFETVTGGKKNFRNQKIWDPMETCEKWWSNFELKIKNVKVWTVFHFHRMIFAVSTQSWQLDGVKQKWKYFPLMVYLRSGIWRAAKTDSIGFSMNQSIGTFRIETDSHRGRPMFSKWRDWIQKMV